MLNFLLSVASIVTTPAACQSPVGEFQPARSLPLNNVFVSAPELFIEPATPTKPITNHWPAKREIGKRGMRFFIDPLSDVATIVRHCLKKDNRGARRISFSWNATDKARPTLDLASL